MNELDDGCCSDVLLAIVTERAGGKQDDERPQALAAAHDDVLRHLGHESDVALEACRNEFVNGLHVGAGELGDIGKRRQYLRFFYRVHETGMMPELPGLGDTEVPVAAPKALVQAIEFKAKIDAPGR